VTRDIISGGTGGNAEVEGDYSSAQGGDAGQAVQQPGGRGGHAKVRGNHSIAVGGKGGRGGVTPGSPGGDVEIVGDFGGAWGGQGGEAPQADGRGGRGGRSGGADFDLSMFTGQVHRPQHIKWPYGEPVTEYGRGGDSADTPQYRARRIIVENLKRCEFGRRSLDINEAWWDRKIVSVDWINRCLVHQGHAWQMRVVDDEYEFFDIPPK